MMEPRYSLRFENGERKGETIPVPEGGLSVGRKPGHSLQIVDNSVSGSHAELAIDKFGVTVKDTGSTNGTRVNGERVIEKRLAHGDALVFGTVELRFADGSKQATVFGGGRYDGLAEALGGPHVPGVGFGMGSGRVRESESHENPNWTSETNQRSGPDLLWRRIC